MKLRIELELEGDYEHFGDKSKNTRLFDQLPNLKVVSTVSAGFDHLDIDYLRNRQIRIGHTPRQVAAATADMALALMLAGARNLVRGSKGAVVTSFNLILAIYLISHLAWSDIK